MSEAATTSSGLLNGSTPSAASAGESPESGPAEPFAGAANSTPPTGYQGELPLPQGVVRSDALFIEDGAEGTEPAAIDANPGVTAMQLQSHLVQSAGVDPVVAGVYIRRFEKALTEPAPTQEQLQTGNAETMVALRELYGERAERVVEAARGELRELARGFPQLRDLLERTGMGNDVSLIRALAGRDYDKWLARSGLPPRG